jgi:ABC-type amino acid transport substrate-binding protein
MRPRRSENRGRVVPAAMTSALLAFAILLGLAGPAVAQEIRPTLDKIKETGAIQLGYRETSRPFSFVGTDGQPAGYSVDLCLQVVAALQQRLKLSELKVHWVSVTPAVRVARLVKGTIDLECGSTTITFGRMEQVAFSHMIMVDGGSLLATVDSGVGAVRDLSGKRVGVIANTTTEKALADALTAAGIKAQVVVVTDHGEGLQGLEAGRLDAYASDRLLLAGLLATAKNPAKLRLSGELYSYEPYALMLRRGDNAFQAEVNRALSALYRSKQIVPIYEKWFGPFASASPLVQALYLLHSWPE